MPKIKHGVIVSFDSNEEADQAAKYAISFVHTDDCVQYITKKRVRERVALQFNAHDVHYNIMRGVIRRTARLGHRIMSTADHYYVQSKEKPEKEHLEVKPAIENKLSLGNFDIVPEEGSVLDFSGAKRVEVEIINSDSFFCFSGNLKGSLEFEQ
jgi:hypothetical protein